MRTLAVVTALGGLMGCPWWYLALWWIAAVPLVVLILWCCGFFLLELWRAAKLWWDCR